MLISNADHILTLSTCVISTSHTSRIYMCIIRLSPMPLVAFVVPTTRFRFRRGQHVQQPIDRRHLNPLEHLLKHL